MSNGIRFTILGCGASAGVPRPDGDWGACDPSEAKNRRSRSSLLVEKETDQGKTTIIIDTGADFRNQVITAGVREIDAILYTHAHADHIHGLDDLRSFVFARSKQIDIYADDATLDRLYGGFNYCFETPDNSDYPPILRANRIENDVAFSIRGKGGEVVVQPHNQIHGKVFSKGFRIGNVAYCTDVSSFPEGVEDKLSKLDVLIIDALQYNLHPCHFCLMEALEWSKRLKPKRTILTHMHIFMDYHKILRETPKEVEPAYDGMVFSCEDYKSIQRKRIDFL